MDPSLVLEQTIQDISNLQAEFQYMLKEMRRNDNDLSGHKKTFAQKDGQLQKFIKQKGSNTDNPDEEKVVEEVNEEMKTMESLQNEKCLLANTALFLVSRHVTKLEKDMAILEEEGVLPPIEDEIMSGSELSKESSVSSIGERKKRATSGVTTPPVVKKKKIAAANIVAAATATSQKSQLQQQTQPPPGQLQDGLPNVSGDITGIEKLHKNKGRGLGIKGGGHSIENDEEDKTLYCFCQRVSFGEMVACDGPNCKYEWFHYGCVNLKEPPKGTWYCPDCTQEMAKTKQKRKRT
mgnify:CR=1 FL=1